MSLAIGIGIGIYIAQNYDIPDIKSVAEKSIRLVKSLEKASKKEQDS